MISNEPVFMEFRELDEMDIRGRRAVFLDLLAVVHDCGFELFDLI